MQEATGKQIVSFAENGFSANGIVHELPLVGKYLYVPRGPRTVNKEQSANIKPAIERLIEIAREKNAKWVRIEPETEELLGVIQKEIEALRRAQIDNLRVVKAPHDMQPREIFKIDITPSEEELLAAMKPKTRYNIRLAEKRGVKVFETREEKFQQAFLDLITTTAGRKGIASHPRSYYEQFFKELPEEMCRLFVAEYEGVVLAVNMLIFFGDTVTYLHGGSGDQHRDTMAPYLLQWEQIKRAKAEGYQYYDFGGVHTEDNRQETHDNGLGGGEDKKSLITHPASLIAHQWGGITKFKMGFSPVTSPTVFPGTYDITLDSRAYFLYDALRRLGRVKKCILKQIHL